jgi:hypothetical protein
MTLENLAGVSITSSPSTTESQEKTQDYAERGPVNGPLNGPATVPSGIIRHSACFMQSPQGEIREVEATAEALSPLLSKGWNQVPTPAGHKPAVPAEEEK